MAVKDLFLGSFLAAGHGVRSRAVRLGTVKHRRAKGETASDHLARRRGIFAGAALAHGAYGSLRRLIAVKHLASASCAAPVRLVWQSGLFLAACRQARLSRDLCWLLSVEYG